MTELAHKSDPVGPSTATPARRRSPMEMLFNMSVFVLFAVLWAAFALALVVRQGSLDQTWQWIQGMPWLVQAVIWLLFLPVVAGLWIWESTWPVIVRVALVASLGFWNLYIFLPRGLSGGRT
jgi:hypothetical protein